jgi:hypothetical protein
MRWSQHIDNITSKASSKLGFLRRNLKSCPRDTKKLAYLQLVRSTIEYSASIWDPHLQKDIDKLEVIQKKAARFIHGDYISMQPGCVSKMLDDLNLPTLEQRRKEEKLLD